MRSSENNQTARTSERVARSKFSTTITYPYIHPGMTLRDKVSSSDGRRGAQITPSLVRVSGFDHRPKPKYWIRETPSLRPSEI
ncbi:hypothetical protein M413DRAFT_447990 [Hebeloma cylindrosporum]|uniref:Uncharacterized protein n=1 Tax=Hebeloma cylindrosporum TaxID=76867 RepID=A0A0C3BNL4_HEBCY|nr:hypothetical protein M413DRAFT_447990 [Hebeloma cylindrosporum h7]